MELTVSTPALFFPCISLLMVAYTNKFIAISKRIRDLHSEYIESPDDILHNQIVLFRKRLFLIRNMQITAIFSFLMCIICILLIFVGYINAAKVVFTICLLSFMLSLFMALREILISVNALDIQLTNFEFEHTK